MEFKQSVKDAINYYVYALVSPINHMIFYIGKGKGDRVFQHAEDALHEDSQSLKLDTIRMIIAKGEKVEYYILRHNLTEEDAYLLESTLIDMLTYPKFNNKNQLTNVVSGHHQWDDGIKSIDELNALYDCSNIKVNAHDKLLLVSLNRSFNQAKANGVYRRLDIYESARKYWAIGKDKPQEIDYVLGVYKGIVRCVIKVESHEWVSQAEDGTVFKKPRCCFNGQILNDSPYLNKDVSDYPFGSGGAIRYIY